jgi:hypothetical protein
MGKKTHVRGYFFSSFIWSCYHYHTKQLGMRLYKDTRYAKFSLQSTCVVTHTYYENFWF